MNIKEKHFCPNIFMNMNYSYRTTMYESIFAQMYTMYIFLVKKYFFPFLLKKFHGKNTFIHCSRITVAHVHV